MTGDARTEPRCLISLADDAMYEDKQRRRSRETAASG
jgi:hypothetical protein